MDSTQDLRQQHLKMRGQQFLRAGWYWLRDLDRDKLNALALDVSNALHEGRAAIHPSLQARPAGLLGVTLPIDDVELAFTLWLDGQGRDFRELLDRYGHATVFAYIGLTRAEALSTDSLARLSEFLAMNLEAEARAYKPLALRYMKQSQGLKKGPEAAATQKQKDKKDRVARARLMAADYKRAHPAASVDEMVNHLMRSEQFDGWHARSSYEGAIKGVANEALQSLDRSRPR